MDTNLNQNNLPEQDTKEEKKENKVLKFVKNAANGAVTFGKKVAKPIAFMTLGALITKGLEYFLGTEAGDAVAETVEPLIEAGTETPIE